MSKAIIKAQPQEVVPVTAFNVEGLISLAIEKGTPVDTMERLLAMRTQLKNEFAKEAFNQAMAKFQSECPVIEKTKEVKTKSGVVAYRYAPIESIVEQVKAHLQANGFSYSTNMRMLEAGVEVTVKVTHSAGHSETTQMTVPLGTKTDIMSASQVVAAAQTFAKRYAFCNAFGILTGDEDNDAQPMQTTPQRPPANAVKQPAVAKPATLGAVALDFIDQLNKATTFEKATEIAATIREAQADGAINKAEIAAIVKASKQAAQRIQDEINQPPPDDGTVEGPNLTEEEFDQMAKDSGLAQ